MDNRTRIEKLQALANHPATPLHEKRAAIAIINKLSSTRVHPWVAKNTHAFRAYKVNK